MGWSRRFWPTWGESRVHLIPKPSSCFLGPTPDSMSNLGGLKHACGDDDFLFCLQCEVLFTGSCDNYPDGHVVINDELFRLGLGHQRDIRMPVQKHGAGGTDAFVDCVHALHKPVDTSS